MSCPTINRMALGSLSRKGMSWRSGHGRTMDDRDHRRIGIVRDRRASGRRMARCGDAVGSTFGPDPARADRRYRAPLSAPPRPRPSDSAARSERARQYRCHEALRLHRSACYLLGRLAARGAGTGQVRRRRSIHRPYSAAPTELLRHRHGCARFDGRAGLPALVRLCRNGGHGSRRGGEQGRDLSGDGRSAILDPRGKPALSSMGGRT